MREYVELTVQLGVDLPAEWNRERQQAYIIARLTELHDVTTVKPLLFRSEAEIHDNNDP